MGEAQKREMPTSDANSLQQDLTEPLEYSVIGNPGVKQKTLPILVAKRDAKKMIAMVRKHAQHPVPGLCVRALQKDARRSHHGLEGPRLMYW